MHVFIHGDGVRPPPATHFMMVCPAGHLTNTEMPLGWVDQMNRPKEFQIVFTHGRAEVDDEMGRYLTKNGLAEKTSAKLFRPPWE